MTPSKKIDAGLDIVRVGSKPDVQTARKSLS